MPREVLYYPDGEQSGQCRHGVYLYDWCDKCPMWTCRHGMVVLAERECKKCDA